MTPHLHLSIFGFSFTLPQPSNSDDGDPGQNGDLICIRLDQQNCTPAGNGLHSPTFLDGGSTSLIVQVDGGLLTRPRFSPITAIAAPLCDTARHERSGVQLI